MTVAEKLREFKHKVMTELMLFGKAQAFVDDSGDFEVVEQPLGDQLEHTQIGVHRTHHPFLHPTKGWRYFARPAGTNRRRKLIPVGAGLVPGSHAFNQRTRSGFRLAKG